MLRAAGLPEPLRQIDIRDRQGSFIGRVDLAIGNVLIECDGRDYHGREDAFVKDRDRRSRLQAEGYDAALAKARQLAAWSRCQSHDDVTGDETLGDPGHDRGGDRHPDPPVRHLHDYRPFGHY